MFGQSQNLFTNLVFKSYEKSSTQNFHDVFIYNTLFLDSNASFPLTIFAFIGPIFNQVVYRACVQFMALTQYDFLISLYFQHWTLSPRCLVFHLLYLMGDHIHCNYFNSCNLELLNTTQLGHVDVSVSWKNILLCQGIFIHVIKFVREYILSCGQNLLKMFFLVH